MTNESLTGFWKLKSIRHQTDGSTWVQETVYGGGIAFTENAKTVLFARTSEGHFGYSGSFTTEQSKLLISIDAAMSEELENQTMVREIKLLSKNEILLSGDEIATGRKFEAIYQR